MASATEEGMRLLWGDEQFEQTLAYGEPTGYVGDWRADKLVKMIERGDAVVESYFPAASDRILQSPDIKWYADYFGVYYFLSTMPGRADIALIEQGAAYRKELYLKSKNELLVEGSSEDNSIATTATVGSSSGFTRDKMRGW